MFGDSSSIVAKDAPPFAQNSLSHKLISAIQNQVEGTPAHLVFVIDIVSVRFGGYFTPSIRAELEKFRYLQMLTLNDCGIVSLLNFPTLPALIRLDMVFNQIPGSDLKHLVTSKHLQTLMLGANQIGSIDEVLALSGLRQLMQLDFINNPVCKAAGYRTTIFDRFPTLTILDTLDKAGKDAYASSTMMQAVARVPDNLFDKSLPPPPAPKPVHVQAHKKQVNKLAHALARAGSLDSVASSRPAKSAVVRDRGKYAKSAKVVSGRSRSSRAGLIFPIGRINRKVKQLILGSRVSLSSSVYLSAVLEYLTAELLEISGNEAKRDGKKRIVPSMIRNSLSRDEQMKNLLRNVTIGLLGE